MAAPGDQPTAISYGNGRLYTELWPYGTVIADPNYVEDDGSIGMKWPWVRGAGVSGPIMITGHRLDGQGSLRAEIHNEAYGSTGFVPSGLYFSSEGCWKIEATVGADSLSVVTLVIKAPKPLVSPEN